jgi:hypothetical protein
MLQNKSWKFWLIAVVGLLFASCCVLGMIVNAFGPKTAPVTNTAPTAEANPAPALKATSLPTMTVKVKAPTEVPTEAPIVVPTKLDGTCKKETIQLWSTQMSAVISSIIESSKAGQAGDFNAGANATADALNLYMTVESPDCDKSAASIHKTIGMILTLYGDSFIQINRGNLKDAKADVEVAVMLMQRTTPELTALIEKYK